MASEVPLILFVGREPNADEAVGQGLGTYDFDAVWESGKRASSCNFWNTAYSVLGEYAGMSARDLKSISRARRVSPIVFADALPISVPSGLPAAEHRRRASENLASVKEHVEAIFSHAEVIRWVKLILYAGLRPEFRGFHFMDAVSEFDGMRNNIEALHIPFLYSGNKSRILSTLSANPTTHELAKEVALTFIQ